MSTTLETPRPHEHTASEKRSERRGFIVLVSVYLIVAAVNATLLYMAMAEAAATA